MAKRANVRAIGVLGPFPTERGLRAARPALLLDSIQQLPRHLMSIRGKAKNFQQLTDSKSSKEERSRQARRQKKRRPARRTGA